MADEHNDLNEAVLHLLAFRRIWLKHFPFSRSAISLDIILFVLNAKLQNEIITVKNLFASIHFSDMGIRYHFNSLVDDGWIEVVGNLSDRRLKLCKPSTRLENAFKSAVEDLEKSKNNIFG